MSTITKPSRQMRRPRPVDAGLEAETIVEVVAPSLPVYAYVLLGVGVVVAAAAAGVVVAQVIWDRVHGDLLGN